MRHIYLIFHQGTINPASIQGEVGSLMEDEVERLVWRLAG